jgi:hypothetical protein
MKTALKPENHFRFGVFELDLEAGELRKNGLKIKLQDQPYQVLVLLVKRPGQIVTREEICQQLWPDGTFVEFDRSLNIAVNKIRDALGDSANSPLPQSLSMDYIPRWSGDGQWIYFASDRSGTVQLWKMPASGTEAEAVRITKERGETALESPDGASLYYTRAGAKLCRVPVNGGPEVTLAESVRWRHFAVTEKGIWFVREPAALNGQSRLEDSSFFVWFHSFATGTARRVADLGNQRLVGFTVSSDSRFMAWSVVDRQEDDLVLVENFE